MKISNCHHTVTPYTSPHGITSLHFFIYLIFIFPTFLHLTAAQSPSSTDEPLANSSISPSMALIVIVLVLVFFITGTISVYIQCAGNSNSGGIPITNGVRSRRGNVSRGLDVSVIESFPTFVYSSVKELKIGKGSLECAVCLSEFEDDDHLRLLTKCDHVFHSECVDTWLEGHTTCPVCRANLVPESAESLSQDTEFETELPSRDGEIPPGEVRVTIGDEVTKRKFPRSHSTGHSLIQPDDDVTRFTLKLPADVRRQLVARSKLKRATSLLALPRASSSRRGYRGGGGGGGGGGEGSGSSRYGRFFGRSTDRWPFGLRMNSFRFTTKVGDDGDMTASSSSTRVLTPVNNLPTLAV